MSTIFTPFGSNVKNLIDLPENVISAITIFSAKPSEDGKKLELTVRPSQEPTDNRRITMSLWCGTSQTFNMNISPLLARMGIEDGDLVTSINAKCPFDCEVIAALSTKMGATDAVAKGYTNYEWRTTVIEATKTHLADRQAAAIAAEHEADEEPVKAPKKKGA